MPIKRPTYKYFMPHFESERNRGCFAFQGTDFHIQGHGRERESRGQNIKRLEKRKRKQKGGKGGGKEKTGALLFLHSGKEKRACEGGGLFALGISVQGWRNVGCVAPARGREQPVIYQQVSNCYFIPSRAACLYT